MVNNEELKISINELKTNKIELQIFISKPFEYGRSPSDDAEYLAIAHASDGLKIINATLFFAEELLESIESNARAMMEITNDQQD